MFQQNREAFVERFAGQPFRFRDFFRQNFDAEIRVPERLPGVGVHRIRRVVREFDRLADVVQERADEQQVGVERGAVMRRDSRRQLHRRRGVFEEPAGMRVMESDAGVPSRKPLDERVVGQEAVG